MKFFLDGTIENYVRVGDQITGKKLNEICDKLPRIREIEIETGSVVHWPTLQCDNSDMLTISLQAYKIQTSTLMVRYRCLPLYGVPNYCTFFFLRTFQGTQNSTPSSSNPFTFIFIIENKVLKKNHIFYASTMSHG